VTVSDTGVGIASGSPGNIFELFAQSHRHERSQEDSGSG